MCGVFGYVLHQALRIRSSHGVHRSVALAVWLTRILAEFGVSATFFLPMLDPDWRQTVRNVVQWVSRPPQGAQ